MNFLCKEKMFLVAAAIPYFALCADNASEWEWKEIAIMFFMPLALVLAVLFFIRCFSYGIQIIRGFLDL